MNQSKLLLHKLHQHRHKLGLLAFAVALLSIAIQTYPGLPGTFRAVASFILSTAFFISAGLSFYLTTFYKVTPDVVAQQASNSENSQSFWKEARRRRRIALWMAPSWLIAGPILVWIYSNVVPSKDPMTPAIAALVTYSVLWFWAAWRFTNMKCFHCNGRAFDNILNFRNHCRSCGTPFKPPEDLSK